MKSYSHRIYTISTFIMLFSIGAFTAILYIFLSSNTTTSALTYQTDSTMSFTFSPMISINVSSSTIDISTLAPGTTAESDPITVTVATNTAYGYSLYADVGNSTDYNTDSLVHSSEDNNSNNNINSTPSVFTSIATNASLSQLTTDNTWGYSYKPSTESTWSTYNGLPLYTTTEGHTSTTNPALLIDTKDPGDSSKSIDFKIAARSSSTQPSGTYSNVINFYAVGKPAPVYMQETETIKSQLKNVGDETQAIDNRDGKEYWVAKLADGNIWMTQNLDLDIEAGRVYTSSDTDLRYSAINTSWTPDISTSTSVTWSSATNYFARSYDPGDLFWNGKMIENNGYNSLSNGTVIDPPATYGGTHYHVGNYYNWTAAVAMNDSHSYSTQYVDADQSICPAGWRMAAYGGDKSYQNLVDAQGLIAGISGNIQSNPAYFVYGGSMTGDPGVKGVGHNANYWSSVVDSRIYAYAFCPYSNNEIATQKGRTRAFWGSVRCVIR